MMNKYLLHIIFIVITITLYSCAGESKDEYLPVAVSESARAEDTISEDIFTELENPNTELTTEQLEAFQLRAIQKFNDFTDYMEIISDPDIKEDLIEHSQKLVEDLFISDSITRRSTDLIWNYALFANSDSLHHPPIIKHWPQIHINIKSIKFTNGLTLDSTNNYNGTINASLIINGNKTTNNIGVHLVEIEKFFGDSSQFITEVRLGNIY